MITPKMILLFISHFGTFHYKSKSAALIVSPSKHVLLPNIPLCRMLFVSINKQH
jgi:hypothetical protein